MQLSGHDGAVLSLKFNPAGDVIASAAFDKFVYLWNVRGECENFMVLKGHKNAILELHWTPDGERLLTASPDKSVRAWDAQTGLQVGHPRGAGGASRRGSCARADAGDGAGVTDSHASAAVRPPPLLPGEEDVGA